MKKFLSLLLAAVLVITSLSCATVAFAEDETDYSQYTLQDITNVEFGYTSDVTVNDNYLASVIATVTFYDDVTVGISAAYPFSENGKFEALNSFRNSFLSECTFSSEIVAGEANEANVREITCEYGYYSNQFTISNLEVELISNTQDNVLVPIQTVQTGRFLDDICCAIDIVAYGYDESNYEEAVELINAPLSDVIGNVAGEEIEFDGFAMGFRTLGNDIASQYDVVVPDDSPLNILFNLNSGDDPLDPESIAIGDEFPISVTWANCSADLNIEFVDITDLYDSIALNEEKLVSISTSFEDVTFLFTPEESGYYIYSSSGEEDTYGDIDDLYQGNVVGEGFGGEGDNFRIVMYMEAGETYKLISHIENGETGSYTVTVEKSPVTSVTYTPAFDIEIKEGTYGEFIEDNGQTIWVYDCPSINYGDQLEITYINDNEEEETVVLTNIGWSDEYQTDGFYNEDEDYFVPLNDLRPSTNQSPEMIWGRDVEGMLFVVTFMGIEATAPVTIVENEYESIIYTPANPIEIEDHTHGNVEREGEEDEFFYYWADEFIKNQGDTITVTPKDGDPVVYTYDTNREHFYNENGERFEEHIEVRDKQWEEHWQAGGTYSFMVLCAGMPTILPVTIIQNSIESVEVNFDTIELVDHVNGDIWEEDGESYFHYNYSLFKDGDTFTINYANGTSSEYTFAGYSETLHTDYFENEAGDIIPVGSISCTDNQWQNHWVLGGENQYIEIGYNGILTRVSVVINENPVSAISFTKAEPWSITENTNGYEATDDNGDTYWEYHTPGFAQGDILTVYYSDDSSTEFVCQGYSEQYSMDYFEDENGNVLTEDDVRRSTNQRQNHWVAGGENQYVIVEYYGSSFNVPVEITVNPIASMEYYQPSPVQIYENTNGEYKTDNNGETYFEYNYGPANEGSYIRVENIDGSEVYYYGDGYWNFFDEDGNQFPYQLMRSDNPYQNEVHWVLGETYGFTLTVADDYYNALFTFEGEVQIIESPYASIEYIPANDIVFYENTLGNWTFDDDENEYFEYDVFRKVRQESDQIVVTYADESVATYTYSIEDGYFLDDEGNRFFGDVVYQNRQNQTHWYVGNSYVFYMLLADVPAPITVTIVENPVAAIEFAHNGSISMIENTNGRYENDENGDFWYYYTPYFFNSGDVLTVYYKDETSSDFYYHWNNEEGYEEDCFVNDNGEVILADEINRSENQWENHWVANGEDQYIILEYMGASCNVPVEITETNVDSISYVYGGGSIKIYADTADIEMQEDENGEFIRYITPYFYMQGDVLTVNYKDGSSSEYRFIGYSSTYENDVFEDDNGNVILARDIERNDNQWENHWVLNGEDQYITLNYMGAAFNVYVEIIENPVSAIEYTMANPISYVENTNGYTRYSEAEEQEYWYYQISGFTNGDVLTVYYSDGTSCDYTYVGYDEDKHQDVNAFISAAGDSISGNDVSLFERQHENHWYVDGDYNYMYARYMQREYAIPVEITADLLQSIQFIPADDLVMYENGFGEFEQEDENEPEYFRYDLNRLVFVEGSQIILNYNDSTSDTFTCISVEEGDGYTYLTYVNSDGVLLDDIGNLDASADFPWALGGDNTLTVIFRGQTYDVPVTIIESNVQSIEYIPPYDIELIDGVTNCWYNEELGAFEYNVDVYYTDAQLVVTYDDNTSKTFTCNDRFVFVTDDGEELAGYLNVTDNQHEDPWDELGAYEFSIEYLGASTTATAHIVETPVTSLEFNGDNPLFISESDLENNSFLSDYFYRLGRKLIVRDKYGNTSSYIYRYKTFNNGYRETFFCDEWDNVLPNEWTLTYYYDDNEPFVYGKDNTLDIGYLGYVTNIPVWVYRENADCDESALVNAIQRTLAMDLVANARCYTGESLMMITEAYNSATQLLGTNASQETIDAATRNLLTAISELEPYLNLKVSANNGSVSVAYDDFVGSAGRHSVVFGTEVTLTAAAGDGFTFMGWYDTVSCRIMSTDAQYTFKLTSNTNLKALCVANASATLTFANDSGWIAGTVTKTVEEWQTVTSLDDMLPDLPYAYECANSSWDYDELEILTKLQSGEDALIVAYCERVEPDRPEIAPPSNDKGIPELTLAYSFDNDACVGSFIMAAAIPEGCEVESVGIAFYYQRATVFVPQTFDLNINNKMLTSQFNPSNESDYYIVDLKNMNSDYNWAVKGYVTYYDANGKLLTAYSNQINIIDGQLAD